MIECLCNGSHSLLDSEQSCPAQKYYAAIITHSIEMGSAKISDSMVQGFVIGVMCV